MTGCEVVIAVSLVLNRQGETVGIRARPLPCRVVRANWQRWQREGRLAQVRTPWDPPPL